MEDKNVCTTNSNKKYRTEIIDNRMQFSKWKNILHDFAEYVTSFELTNSTIKAACLGKHEIKYHFGHILLVKPADRENKTNTDNLDEIKSVRFGKESETAYEICVETYEGYQYVASAGWS